MAVWVRNQEYILRCRVQYDNGELQATGLEQQPAITQEIRGRCDHGLHHMCQDGQPAYPGGHTAAAPSVQPQDRERHPHGNDGKQERQD